MISFVSGTLPNAVSAVVACHVSMCRVCASDTSRLEMLGGLMLERLEADPAAKSSAEATMAGWTGGDPAGNDGAAMTLTDDPLLAPLLRARLPLSEKLSWSMIGEGVRQHRIPLPSGWGQMRLMRLAPGEVLPEAQNQGSELILVLRGVFRTGANDHLRGDIIERSDETAGPIRAVGDVECACLVGTERAAGLLERPYRVLRDLRRTALSTDLRLDERRHRQTAMAAAIAIVIGVGLGWLVRGAPETNSVAGLMRVDGRHLVARGPLDSVLNQLPSGSGRTKFVRGHSLQFGVKMTFQDQAGNYCRQYRIAAAPSEYYSGIACLNGDDWLVKIHALVPSGSSAVDKTVPADGEASSAMDAVIGTWMAGNPIVGSEETAIIGRGWRKYA